MLQKEEITIYHFKTKSPQIAKAIEIICNDQKSRDLVIAFDAIKKRKRRNVALRMVQYLSRGGSHG